MKNRGNFSVFACLLLGALGSWAETSAPLTRFYAIVRAEGLDAKQQSQIVRGHLARFRKKFPEISGPEISIAIDTPYFFGAPPSRAEAFIAEANHIIGVEAATIDRLLIEMQKVPVMQSDQSVEALNMYLSNGTLLERIEAVRELAAAVAAQKTSAEQKESVAQAVFETAFELNRLFELQLRQGLLRPEDAGAYANFMGTAVKALIMVGGKAADYRAIAILGFARYATLKEAFATRELREHLFDAWVGFTESSLIWTGSALHLRSEGKPVPDHLRGEESSGGFRFVDASKRAVVYVDVRQVGVPSHFVSRGGAALGALLSVGDAHEVAGRIAKVIRLVHETEGFLSFYTNMDRSTVQTGDGDIPVDSFSTQRAVEYFLRSALIDMPPKLLEFPGFDLVQHLRTSTALLSTLLEKVKHPGTLKLITDLAFGLRETVPAGSTAATPEARTLWHTRLWNLEQDALSRLDRLGVKTLNDPCDVF